MAFASEDLGSVYDQKRNHHHSPPAKDPATVNTGNSHDHEDDCARPETLPPL